MADVAKLAGVSAITVSRALNTPASVSNKMLERVRAAVSQSGYVPNLVAGGLASNRSRLVAALVPTVAGPVFLETIQALTDTLAEAGNQLMLGQTGYAEGDGDREDALLDAIIGRRPAGIVLTGVMHSAQRRRRLIASGIPVVETWDLSDAPIDMMVGFSHEAVGVAVADALFARGFRRPGIVPAPSSLAHGRTGFAELRRQYPEIDMVFCGSDVIAHGVITEVQATGLFIPRDVAVMGFGDMPFAEHTHPPLTTVRIDGRSIGRQAARFILDRVAKQEVGPLVRDVGFAIVQRAST